MLNATEAKCDGTTLTAAFPTANPPLIWRFDLERNHSFTFSQRGGDGKWELGVTSPNGDFYAVAHFTSRAEADDALVTVGHALAHKRSDFTAKIMTSKGIPSTLIVRSLQVVGVAAVVIILAVFLVSSLLRHKTHAVASAVSAPTVVQEDGVPLSADDVLKPPL